MARVRQRSPLRLLETGAALHRRLPSGGTTDLADDGGETFGGRLARHPWRPSSAGRAIRLSPGASIGGDRPPAGGLSRGRCAVDALPARTAANRRRGGPAGKGGGSSGRGLTRRADQIPNRRRHAVRLPAALLAYSIALAAFLIVPPYLKASVGPPQAFTLQEAADLLTPLVVIPLAWLVFDLAGGLGRRGLFAFLVLGALWVEGQGIHLAANAIGDAFSHAAAEAFYQTVPGELNLWLDETLSHWMWHGAWVGLSVLILAAATRGASGQPRHASVTAVVAGLIYGADVLPRVGRGSDDAARHRGVDPDPGLVPGCRAPRVGPSAGRHVLPRVGDRDAGGVRGLGRAERLDAPGVQQGRPVRVGQ